MKIAFTQSNQWGAKLIRWFTKSNWSHCLIVLDDDLEGEEDDYSASVADERDFDIGVSISESDDDGDDGFGMVIETEAADIQQQENEQLQAITDSNFEVIATDQPSHTLTVSVSSISISSLSAKERIRQRLSKPES